MARKSDKPEEGVTYYFSPGGNSFKSPKINADAIYKILENKTIEEGLTKQQRILFQKPVQLSVMNTKTKEVDEDLTTIISDMALEDDIALNFAIQRAWRDMAEWGPALYNPVWDYEGSEFRMKKLKRLEPWSFANLGPSISYIQNKILPGILLNDLTQGVEYWQTDSKGRIVQLRNVEVLTDPIKSGLGGTPAIVPIFPYVKMMTYSWMRQMQKVNQYGSGGIWFLKVTDPTGDDKKFAQNLVNNVSSVNRYQLRPNMTIENLGLTESGSALETITQLGMEIRQFFTPAGLIQKDGGTLLGGSSGPEFDLYMAFISGQHSTVEAYVRRLFNPYLVYNGYYDKGFRLVAKFPEPTVDKSELFLKIHDSGSREGSLLINEKRALLRAALPQQADIDISDLDPAAQAELESYTQRNKPAQSFNPQLQKAETVAKVMAADPDNPLIQRGTAKKIIQAQLGIEEGLSVEDDTPLQSDAIGAINRLTKATGELVKVAKKG